MKKMTNKRKFFIFSFLAIFSIFSTASAVEFYWDIRTEEVVGEYNWYNMHYQENSYNYLWCILKRYSSNANLKTTKFCEDWNYVIHSTSSYVSVLRDNYTYSSAWNFVAWKKDDSNNIFSFKVLNDEWKKKFYRFWIKNVWGKSVKLNSKRGSAVYNTAFMDGIWFVLSKRDWDQVRVSHVVDNVFALDGFLVVARDWDSYLIDTYTNKMYKYTNGLFPMNRYAKGEVESIFPKIWDNVPSQVSDIQRWPLAEYKMYYNQNEFKSFDLKNTREATEADLNEIRENIKKSLVVFNQDALKLYRDVDWLDLSVWDSSDLPSNPNSNNTKNNSVEEKKSCVAYYTYMRSMSSHSDWCLGEVHKDMSDTRLDYWWAISTDWDLSKFGVRDKTKYRRCWHWNNYKEGVKKTLWDKWPAFWKDWQTNYIATEAKDIDVNALCSHIVVWSQINSWGLTFDNFSKAIEWTLLSRGDTVWTLNWVSVLKNVFERDYALMMRYEIACKDKVRLPTEYDNTFSDLLLFKTFWNDNNKNVCKKAEELKEKFKEKYKDLIFTKNYEKAFKSDFGEDSVSSSWNVVIEKALSWSIDKALKVKSLSGLWEKTAWALVDYFTKDYTDWYNKGFSLLGWKGCGAWIWVKEWDYIMRLFFFMILIWLVWKS